MKATIEHARDWLRRHPKARQWAWFAGLWLAGLVTVSAVAYPIKWLIRSI